MSLGNDPAKPQTQVQPSGRWLRPADLAREHGLSAQAVRNYEHEGVLPASTRSEHGYRRYTPVHAQALRAYLALVRAHGYATAGDVMRAVNRRDLDTAVAAIDRSHVQLQRDRETLDSVAAAVEALAGDRPATGPGPWSSIGEVAHRIGVTAATVRKWERAGLLVPGRDATTGHRRYTADDVRDAEVAHLLRRGGYGLAHIATVLDHLRDAGGAEALRGSLDDWRQRLTTRALAMLTAAGQLAAYLRELDGALPLDGVTHVRGER